MNENKDILDLCRHSQLDVANKECMLPKQEIEANALIIKYKQRNLINKCSLIFNAGQVEKIKKNKEAYEKWVDENELTMDKSNGEEW